MYTLTLVVRRLRLFSSLVWRRWEATEPQSRLDVRLAWEVACRVHPR